jgi:hypothetical protein
MFAPGGTVIARPRQLEQDEVFIRRHYRAAGTLYVAVPSVLIVVGVSTRGQRASRRLEIE